MGSADSQGKRLLGLSQFSKVEKSASKKTKNMAKQVSFIITCLDQTEYGNYSSFKSSPSVSLDLGF